MILRLRCFYEHIFLPLATNLLNNSCQFRANISVEFNLDLAFLQYTLKLCSLLHIL